MRVRRPSAQTRLVLVALAAEGNSWRFGYELSRETGLASGTIYPLLARLAARGYLESRWEQTVAGRPPRHLYRLSADGTRYIAEHRCARVDRSRPESACTAGMSGVHRLLAALVPAPRDQWIRAHAAEFAHIEGRRARMRWWLGLIPIAGWALTSQLVHQPGSFETDPWVGRAFAVSALIERYDAAEWAEPRARPLPFSQVPGEAVEQQDAGSTLAVITKR